MGSDSNPQGPHRSECYSTQMSSTNSVAVEGRDKPLKPWRAEKELGLAA
jgi:hypothetical protein